MKEFCAMHSITIQLVPAYLHLLQCRVEGAIRVTKSHARISLKQSEAPLRFWARATSDFVRKKNHLWARRSKDGIMATAFERLQPVAMSNSHEAIAVPIGCKVVAQIPRESSFVTNTTHAPTQSTCTFLEPTQFSFFQTGSRSHNNGLSETCQC